MRTFAIVDTATQRVIQEVEADYIRMDDYVNAKFYQAMPWYRFDRCVGYVNRACRMVGIVPKGADVLELEKMVRL